MPKRAAREQTTNIAISAETQQLLLRIAERSGTNLATALEDAIREKALREQVTLPGPESENGIEAEPGAPDAVDGAAPIDLRPLAARAAAGDASASAEIQRIVAELRATAIVTPAKRHEVLDPNWQERFLALVEGVRRGVPEEWTEDELQEQIALAIAEVRSERARNH